MYFCKKDKQYEAVAIGASAGGVDALRMILSGLPHDFYPATIIVQHLPPASDEFLPQFLNKECLLPVMEADEKIKIRHNSVYIAPSNYHLLVEEDRTFSLSVTEKINYARPSIDVLFETAAFAYGSALIGVILTGANKDGVQGLKKIKESGGLTIVQDPKTAQISTMPQKAISAFNVDYILPLQKIASFLSDF